MAKTKTKKIPFGERAEIMRTNRIYMSLKAIGEVDEKGKSVFSIGYSGKNIAEPDRPLSTMVYSFVLHIANMAKYSTPEDRDKDLAELKRLINSMEWRKENDDARQ